MAKQHDKEADGPQEPRHNQQPEQSNHGHKGTVGQGVVAGAADIENRSVAVPRTHDGGNSVFWNQSKQDYPLFDCYARSPGSRSGRALKKPAQACRALKVAESFQ